MHCPTGKMIADFMSKPVQGSLFTKFCTVLMGWEHISTLCDISSLSEERVENCDKKLQNSKKPKMSYTDILRYQKAVQIQNNRISGREFNLHQLSLKMKNPDLLR